MKKILTIIFSIALFAGVQAQGNHVFTGGEAVNFGTVDLATPGGQTWSTDRVAIPGYFSAVGTATYTSPSDLANVNGYVKHYADAANQAYTFPVGSGTDLRTITTSGTIPATAEYATAWILGDPATVLDPTSTGAAAGPHPTTSFASPIMSVSPVGQWDWQDLSGNAAGVTITVSIPDLTGMHPLLSSASSLRLVGWNGTQWVDLSGAATASGITENSTLSGTMIAGITAIGIGAVSNVLPLQLISFNGVSRNCDAILSWQTADEINTGKFIIEQSTDGVIFNQVTTVKASGNINSKNYTTTIAQSAPVAYYRMKMIDRDGAFKYSPVVVVKTNCNVSKEYMTLYPNPAGGVSTVYLSFATSFKGKANLIFTNALGQQFITKQVQVNSGANVLPLDVQTLAAGTYFVSLVTPDGVRIGNVQKIIK